MYLYIDFPFPETANMVLELLVDIFQKYTTTFIDRPKLKIMLVGCSEDAAVGVNRKLCENN